MQAPLLTAEELNEYMGIVYPQIMDHYPGFRVNLVEPGHVVVQVTTNENHLRAGNTVSGPTLFALSDMGGYACVLSHIGRQALAVTTNLNINFMRKAEAGVLIADNRILKLGKRLMVFDTTITEEGSDDIIAHATGTYAIPPK